MLTRNIVRTSKTLRLIFLTPTNARKYIDVLGSGSAGGCACVQGPSRVEEPVGVGCFSITCDTHGYGYFYVYNTCLILSCGLFGCTSI